MAFQGKLLLSLGLDATNVLDYEVADGRDALDVFGIKSR
jgi:hypothetical protein